MASLRHSRNFARGSLDRIKEKQQKRTDRIDAVLEIQQQDQESDLQTKLHQTGILEADPSAKRILEKINSKQKILDIEKNI